MAINTHKTHFISAVTHNALSGMLKMVKW